MSRTKESIIMTMNDMGTGNTDGMFEPEFLSYDDDAHKLEMRFPVLDWEINSKQVMHGAAVTGILDYAMGILANDVTAGEFAPSASINVNFIKAIPADADMLVTARIISRGRRIINLHAEARIEKTGVLAADAAGIYTPVTYKPSKASAATDE
mgnify:CR=1 FL=1